MWFKSVTHLTDLLSDTCSPQNFEFTDDKTVYSALSKWFYTTYTLHGKEHVKVGDIPVSLSSSVYAWRGHTCSTWYAVHLWVQCATSAWQMNIERSLQWEMARKLKYLGQTCPVQRVPPQIPHVIKRSRNRNAIAESQSIRLTPLDLWLLGHLRLWCLQRRSL
jgi:hypothetical protein